MFHYQIGSLEEEPHLMAGHLASLGHKRVALVQDRSPIGNRYGAFFDNATESRAQLAYNSRTGQPHGLQRRARRRLRRRSPSAG